MLEFLPALSFSGFFTDIGRTFKAVRLILSPTFPFLPCRLCLYQLRRKIPKSEVYRRIRRIKKAVMLRFFAGTVRDDGPYTFPICGCGVQSHAKKFIRIIRAVEGVAAIPVGAYHIGIFLRKHRPAYKYLYIQSRGAYSLYGLLHADYRGGHQRTQAA